MFSVASIDAGFHRLLHLVIVTAAALAVAAPLLLGPAFGVTLRLLGATQEDHRCGCGMKQGRCGCRECEELEAQRRHDMHEPVVTVRSSCDDPTFAPSRAALPPSIVPSAVLLAAPASMRVLADPRTLDDPKLLPIRPPTPPPRHRVLAA